MRLDCERASLRLSLGGVARAAVEWSRRAGRPIVRAGFARGGEARAEAGGRSVCYVQEKNPAYMSATATHLRQFVAELRSSERNYDAIRQAREVLRLALAGYEAASSGQTVWFGGAH
jgi:hypothetical protein